jgi:hypothetical protein
MNRERFAEENKEKRMSRNRLAVVAFMIFVLNLVSGVALRARAQENKTPYPSMAPLDQYLMERSAEIALARSAAPAAISDDATVLVLGQKGYETAATGKNGFVCLVNRSWMSEFDSPEYWNPKNRSALCLNPPAARSILPITYMRTKMVLAGKSTAEIRESVKAGLAKKELPSLEPGAMCYMMSKNTYITDAGSHNMAHLMFYTPAVNTAAFGADLPGSPIILFKADPEPISGFMVGTGRWSDGTPAPVP